MNGRLPRPTEARAPRTPPRGLDFVAVAPRTPPLAALPDEACAAPVADACVATVVLNTDEAETVEFDVETFVDAVCDDSVFEVVFDVVFEPLNVFVFGVEAVHAFDDE